METEQLDWIGSNWKKEEVSSGRVFTVWDEPVARYAWDTGVAMGRYLAGLKRGKLVGARCGQCRRIMIPPRLFCERCFRDVDGWVSVKDTGRINTFSVCFVTCDMKRVETPQIPAVIEVDGASPGMGILHLVRCPDWKKVRVGMRVKAIWKSSSQRRGAITDIQYWVPIP